MIYFWPAIFIFNFPKELSFSQFFIFILKVNCISIPMIYPNIYVLSAAPCTCQFPSSDFQQPPSTFYSLHFDTQPHLHIFSTLLYIFWSIFYNASKLPSFHYPSNVYREISFPEYCFQLLTFPSIYWIFNGIDS